jgi:dihydroxyacetone kinase
MDICRAVDQGAGVLLSFGNYAGDVLNFSAAAVRLRAQGMALEMTSLAACMRALLPVFPPARA